MGKMFASFYSCLVFASFWKVKFWRSLIKCQYFNDGWADFHKKYISLYLYLGFFENRKNSGLTPDQTEDPVTRTWKMTQMTHWPDDPMTQFHVWLVPISFPSPTYSFIPGLKPSFSANPFRTVVFPFFLQDWLHGFPRLLLLLLSYHFLLF